MGWREGASRFDDFLRFSYRGLKGSVDLDVVKRRIKIRRFLAIWVSCVGGSVDLDAVKKRVKNRRFLAI